MKFDSKFTVEDHMSGIAYRVSQRIGILRLVKRIFVDTSVLLHCYFAFAPPILQYNSLMRRSAAECIRWLGFVLIRVSCCVIDIMLLG